MTDAVIHLYLADKMREIPEFNFPEFDCNAAWLRRCNYKVTSPAEMDRDRGFDESGSTGLEAEWQDGAPLRQSLADDLYFIAKEADGVALGLRWKDSSGAIAEDAAAKAVRIPSMTVKSWIRKAWKEQGNDSEAFLVYNEYCQDEAERVMGLT